MGPHRRHTHTTNKHSYVCRETHVCLQKCPPNRADAATLQKREDCSQKQGHQGMKKKHNQNQKKQSNAPAQVKTPRTKPTGEVGKNIHTRINLHIHTHNYPHPPSYKYMNVRNNEGNHPARTKVKYIRPDSQQREKCSMPRRKDKELLNQDAEHQHDRGRK